jgi:hypothetical protein
MDEQELFENIDGLMAYDLGSVDSGIKNDRLKQQIKDYLNGLDDKSLTTILSKYARTYLTDDMIEQGYGIEDIKQFLTWLDEEMNIYI